MANREIREVELKFKSKGLDGVDGKINKTATAVENLKAKSLAGASMATEKLSKGMTDLSASSGLAGATISSLGQGIGDIQYGFGAIANNISQVGSLFGMLVAKSGGVKGALVGLGKQLVGPMGIMFAFQAAVAAINYFTSRTDKAGKQSNKLAEEIAGTTSELHILTMAMDNESISQAERSEIVKDANEKYKDLNLSLDENGKLTEESRLAIERKIKSLEKLAKANVIQGEIEEKMIEKRKLEREQRAVEEEALEKLARKGITNIEDAQDKALNSEDYALRGFLNGVLVEYNNLESKIKDVTDAQNNLLMEASDSGVIGDIIDSSSKGSGKGRRDKVRGVSDLDSEGLSTDLVNSPLKSIDRLIGEIKIAADMELDAISEAEVIKRAKRKEFADMELADKKLQNEQMLQALGMGLGQAARLMTDREGKATKASKAISSASVLIDTYQSASKVYKTYAANPVMAKIMAAATYAGGIARVKAINSVRIPHSGGGQTPSIQAPSFNVIGQGSLDANIVANAVHGQAQQPIQAYVVESQMTSTQEMARAVEETASIS